MQLSHLRTRGTKKGQTKDKVQKQKTDEKKDKWDKNKMAACLTIPENEENKQTKWDTMNHNASWNVMITNIRILHLGSQPQ